MARWTAQRRKRTDDASLVCTQESLLCAAFATSRALTRERKGALAAQTHLPVRQVEVWFQNRRARYKVKDAAARCTELEASLSALREENAALRRASLACAAAMDAMQHAATTAVNSARQESAVARAVLAAAAGAGGGGGMQG